MILPQKQLTIDIRSLNLNLFQQKLANYKKRRSTTSVQFKTRKCGSTRENFEKEKIL